MPITGNASYIPTMNEFIAHWAQCNEATAPQALVVRLPDTDTTCAQPQFVALRDTLQTQQNTVQGCLIRQHIARSGITLRKTVLLAQLNLFTSLLDGYYRNTEFYDARPLAPALGDGQDRFTAPLLDALTLWEKINAGPAPAGVTLPLVLGDGTDRATFASAAAALQSAYAEERRKAQDVTLARAKRNRIQAQAYAVMKTYREAVPAMLPGHPDLVQTMPRLTPLPGHTPAPVRATAAYEAPDTAKVVHEASPDPLLAGYQLRGNAGDEYSEEDAVVIATHSPEELREFTTRFGLTQPGAQVALKLFVLLSTGNECGSAVMRVEHPASERLAAT